MSNLGESSSFDLEEQQLSVEEPSTVEAATPHTSLELVPPEQVALLAQSMSEVGRLNPQDREAFIQKFNELPPEIQGKIKSQFIDRLRGETRAHEEKSKSLLVSFFDKTTQLKAFLHSMEASGRNLPYRVLNPNQYGQTRELVQRLGRMNEMPDTEQMQTALRFIQAFAKIGLSSARVLESVYEGRIPGIVMQEVRAFTMLKKDLTDLEPVLMVAQRGLQEIASKWTHPFIAESDKPVWIRQQR